MHEAAEQGQKLERWQETVQMKRRGTEKSQLGTGNKTSPAIIQKNITNRCIRERGGLDAYQGPSLGEKAWEKGKVAQWGKTTRAFFKITQLVTKKDGRTDVDTFGEGKRGRADGK